MDTVIRDMRNHLCMFTELSPTEHLRWLTHNPSRMCSPVEFKDGKAWHAIATPDGKRIGAWSARVDSRCNAMSVSVSQLASLTWMPWA